MLLETLSFLEWAALALTAYSLYDENPIGSFMSALLWMSAAWGASSIVIYNAPSAAVDAITYTGEVGMIYLFAGFGVLMILNTFRTAFREVKKEVAVKWSQ